MRMCVGTSARVAGNVDADQLFRDACADDCGFCDCDQFLESVALLFSGRAAAAVHKRPEHLDAGRADAAVNICTSHCARQHR